MPFDVTEIHNNVPSSDSGIADIVWTFAWHK